MGFPLYIACCFSLASFNILSLCLVSVSLISMSWHVSPWVYPVWDSLCLLGLIDYFLFHVGEFSAIISSKIFSVAFCLSFLWDPYNLNVDAFNIVPKVSEAILNSFHSFPFILLFSSYFHHSVF